MPNVLCQPSFPGSIGKMPMHEEDHLRLDHHFLEIAPILSSKSNFSYTDQPIKKAMNKPKVARQMVQCAIELS